jgi:hypothetical protein
LALAVGIGEKYSEQVKQGLRARTGLPAIRALAAMFLAFEGCSSIRLPGTSSADPLQPLSAAEMQVSENLRAHVQILAGEFGERNRNHPKEYRQSVEYIAAQFRHAGYFPKLLEPRQIEGVTIDNVEVEIPGRSLHSEVIIVGAHFDTEEDSPGANDNASGVAALLEIARLCRDRPIARTVRFVAFYDEEYFGSRPMGSRVYAGDCRNRGDNIVGMISLETIGYYSDAPHSQHYPLPLLWQRHPSRGDFIALVGNSSSRELISGSMAAFTNHTKFPCEGIAAPWYLAAAGRSDHVSFWQEGYPGFMVTDTADFRYPFYHDAEDTPDKLDYERMARVTTALSKAIQDLANIPPIHHSK